MNAVALEEPLWALTDHACALCYGRILRHGSRFRCSGCEREALSAPTSICGCGLNGRRRGQTEGPVFRCEANTNRSEIPAAIVIKYGEQTVPPPEGA